MYALMEDLGPMRSFFTKIEGNELIRTRVHYAAPL